jgi:hypothetical protein
MTKKSSLACVMAAMLYMGTAVAADDAEAQQAQPTASQTPDTPSKPKEESTRTSPSKSTTTPTQEEPDCNN